MTWQYSWILCCCKYAVIQFKIQWPHHKLTVNLFCPPIFLLSPVAIFFLWKSEYYEYLYWWKNTFYSIQTHFKCINWIFLKPCFWAVGLLHFLLLINQLTLWFYKWHKITYIKVFLTIKQWNWDDDPSRHYLEHLGLSQFTLFSQRVSALSQQNVNSPLPFSFTSNYVLPMPVLCMTLFVWTVVSLFE